MQTCCQCMGLSILLLLEVAVKLDRVWIEN